MKKKRFSEERIAAVLKEAEAGATVTDLRRRNGISALTVLQLEIKVQRLDCRAPP
jgi:hypothetical protein